MVALFDSSIALCIIKPDAVRSGAGSAIEELIEAHMFAVVARMETTLEQVQIKSLFASLKMSPTFDAMVAMMGSGPIVALALRKADAVAELSKLLGPEDSASAVATAPGSLRARFGTDRVSNAVHGSASPEDAQRELKIFFPKIFPRELSVAVVACEESTRLQVASQALLTAAAENEFLAVAVRELKLTAKQATRFAQTQPDAAMGSPLTAGKVVAVLLEKPFAIEDLLALAVPGSAAAAESGMPPYASATLKSNLGPGVRIFASPSAAAAEAEATLLFGAEAMKASMTFAMIKPDAISRADEVVAYAESSGFTIIASQVLTLTPEQVRGFYGRRSLTSLDPKVEAAVTSGSSLVLALSRPSAASAWTALMGPDDPKVAQNEAPLSLRALLGTDTTNNACDGSASEEDAAADLALFFPSLSKSETTLGLLTPDVEAQFEEIIEAAASVGLLVTSRLLTTLSRDRAADFVRMLGPHAPPHAASTSGTPPPKSTYESVVAHLSSGPSLVLSLSGPGAVSQWSALLGPSDPLLAKVRCGGCLRARFGTDATRAVGYGSLSAEDAEAQLKFFFPKATLDAPLTGEKAKAYVGKEITPTLTLALVALCRAKPDKPVEWLARWLMEHKPPKSS